MPFGVGAIEGQAGAPLRVLEAGDGRGAEAAPGAPALDGAAVPPATDYAPGEEPRPREGEPTASVHGELL